MKVKNIHLHVNSGTRVQMEARTEDFDLIAILFPANAPSAIRFYEAFRAGDPLDDRDVLEVSYALTSERPIGPWKIVDMKIAPDAMGRDVLKATLESGGLQATTKLWPPRTPSARLFLKAFQNGKELYDKDFHLLKAFVWEEAGTVGLSPKSEQGILDWNPDWEEYL